MPKRKVLSHGTGAVEERPAKRKKRHNLYLVLDDYWEDGYSVHKVELDDSDSDSDEQPKPFAEPPVARFCAVHGDSYAFLTHGTKIVAMKPPDVSPAILAFDTATSALVAMPWPKFRMNFGRPILISIAGRIFLFINDTHYLGDPPPPPPLPSIWGRTYQPHQPQEPWVWTAVGTPEARLPFTASCGHCHALHPDGCTLFVSAVYWADESEQGTFSFDTDRLEWTRHGDWRLPFLGQAYYVAELDAWVGICRHKGGTGHVCSSDVVPVGAGPTTLPRWKLAEERLFDRECPRHLGARLVHMGGARFCVVEYTWHEGDDEMRCKGDPDGWYVGPPRVVVRLTTFGVKYGADGELRLESRRARCPNVFNRAHGFPDTYPVAFWI
ncbi:hypothetical protein VPH35_124699 [Triticum aestivum]